MDDHHIDETSFGISQHLLEGRSLGQIIRPSTSTFVPVDIRDFPAMGVTVGPPGPVLGIKTVALDLLLAGDSLVEGGADSPSRGRGHRSSPSGSAASVIGSMPNTSHSTRTSSAVASFRAV